MTSLFTAATKRLPVDPTGRDSPEDRLTEIFAAVLDRAHEATRALVGEWIGQVPPGSVQVRTQRPTKSGQRIDLELCFRDRESAKATLVWVEIKLDSGLSGDDQLWEYACDLERHRDSGDFADAQLVFLTRPHDWSEVWSQHPRDKRGWWPPHHVTWLKTSAALARWARNTGEDLFQRMLVQEFVDYLEELHVAPEGLTLEGAIVLQQFGATDEAFTTLLHDTGTRLAQCERLEEYDNWPKTRRAAGWVNYWRTYIPSGEGPRWGDGQAVLEWNFRRRAPRPDRLCFAAGLTWFGTKEEPPWRGTSGWPENLEEYEEDGFPRLYRWLQPEELAARGALHEQVDHLSRWISGTFEDLMGEWPRWRGHG